METIYKMCQSCGMPFKDDPQGGGSNADGSKSHMYCSFCYQNGRFTQPDWTVDQMEAFVKAKLKEMGWFHRLFAGPFSKMVRGLERWKR